MKKHKNLDPRYITTRFKSQCCQCSAELPKGSKALFFPAHTQNRKIFCVPCGQPGYQSFMESLQDEQFYLSLYSH